MSCLLGFEDESIGNEATDFKFNKVGGRPVSLFQTYKFLDK